jgi:hypothetical protein
MAIFPSAGLPPRHHVPRLGYASAVEIPGSAASLNRKNYSTIMKNTSIYMQFTLDILANPDEVNHDHRTISVVIC